MQNSHTPQSIVSKPSTNPIEQTAELIPAPGIAEQNLIQGAAQFMDEGGVFMWIILFMWVFGIAIAVERVKSLLGYDVQGAPLMGSIKKHVLNNEVHDAINLCSDSKALLPHVLKSGLKRANQTKEQITDALEATILEVIPKAEKRLGYLGLIANVSTLIGLLGTIYGLIESFAAVAGADPSQKAQLLALGISKAMNTTALGLISAISIMIVHSVLTTKSEKIISEIEEQSIKLIDLLSTRAPNMQAVKRREENKDVA